MAAENNYVFEVAIRAAANGYICQVREDGQEWVCDDTADDNEVDAFATFLRIILNNYGPSSSRYDDKRIYVIVAPGDKNDAFTDGHAEAIWGIKAE